VAPYTGRIAGYIPFSTVGDLGAEYNRIMARLEPGEWAMFLDHDAMLLINEFWDCLRVAIAQHPDAGAFCTWTNRTGNPRQRDDGMAGDDIRAHERHARALWLKHGFGLADVSGNELTGVCFATSRDAWDKAGPFVHGFGEVDNGYARSCLAAGLAVWRMNGTYVYHQRRTNGYRKDNIRGDIAKRRAIWEEEQRRVGWMTPGEALSLSLVIPSRSEHASFLERTIRSFRQSYAGPLEVIVVDDGSEEPVRDCGADLILRHEVPLGVAASRNQGLAAATGNVVAYSDSQIGRAHV
jgi:hypothetical protein